MKQMVIKLYFNIPFNAIGMGVDKNSLSHRGSFY